jgi:hydrogenase/urease accessory protein HupE
VLVIIVGIGIAIYQLTRRGDIYFSLIIDWALLGILLKRLATIPFVQSVILFAVIGLAFITLGVTLQILRGKVYIRREEE